MVVDDTPESLGLLSDVLVEQGYQVQAVSSGQLALQSAAIHAPDLILLDVKMPEMDGYEVCRRLKSMEQSRNIPIIFISALDETVDKVEGFNAGGVDYVTKPFKPGELLARVGIHLNLRCMQDRLEKACAQMEAKVRERTIQLAQADKGLRESERKFKTIFEEMQECYLMAAMDGTILRVNPATVQTLGYDSPEELIGKNITATIYTNPEDRRKLESVLRKESRVKGYELEFKRKDGEHLIADCAIRLVRGPNDQPVALEGLFRDTTERKKQEEKLKRSEERYALAQRAGNIGSWDWNIQTGNLVWSDTIEPMFGFAPGEFSQTYEAFLGCVHPEDRQSVVDAMNACVQGHRDYAIEHRIVWPDGSVRWVAETGNVFRDGNAKAIRMLGIVQDITERKRAEDERQAYIHFLESLERIDRAIHQADDVEQMLWNFIKAVSAIFHCDRAWLLYPCDPDAPSFRVPIGHNRPEYPGALEQNMEVPMTPAVAQDFQDALAAEGPLSCTLGTDRPVNKDAAEIFGVQAQMFMALHPKVGRSWMFGMHQCSYPRIWSKEEQKLFNEIGRRLADGLSTMLSFRDAKESQEKLKEHRDHLEELVKERTAELTVAKEQAEAGSRAKSDFLARMSHEIRTPLNAVTGLTRLVLKSELTAEQRDYLSKAQIASNNLLAVINDILDFSKVEAGRLELTCAPFDLDLVLEQVADLFSNRVAQKDLELIFAVGPEVPRQLTGDAGRLTQVLTNLLENAVKFTEQGEIVVGVESGQQDPVAGDQVIGAKASGDQQVLKSMQGVKRSGQVLIKFSVRDTGMGISADVLPTLFEPFTQVGSYLTRKHEGTGLGLAICRRLVELMGGRIWAESTPGRGSTFVFTALLEARRLEKSRFSPPADLHGLKVLVVDDSAAARQALSDLLESFTFNVWAVDSGETALEELSRAAMREPYQLVLMDWKMPGMDGIETARCIRSMEFKVQSSRFKIQDESSGLSNQAADHKPQTRNQEPITPIIILVTAYGHDLVQELIDGAEVDSVLLKPVKPSKLFDTIMTLFGRAEAGAPRIKPQSAEHRGPLAGRRVLLVEDSELNRDVAVALLEEAGLLVEIATNGREAVDKVTGTSKGSYDAVLMDIQMPAMDGFQATSKIRAYERQQAANSEQPATIDQEPGTKTPIIALTAHALAGEKEKCLAAGMDDYLAKPIDEEQLGRILLKWIAPPPEQARMSNPQQARGPTDPGAVLDVRGALKRLGGRRQIYVKVLEKFAPEFDKVHETIARHLAAGDSKTAARIAHSVKGAAATIGAAGLAEAAAKLEKAVSGKGGDIDAQLKDVQSRLDLVLEAAADFLENEPIQ